jgi:hypothetical protein
MIELETLLFGLRRREGMNTKLTEDDMRRALFGEAVPAALASQTADTVSDVEFVQPKTKMQRNTSRGFTPRLKVTLRVGNDFEGEMREIVHEADTLSSLLAEQDAVRAARHKFRYVEVVSVKSI